MKIYFWQNEKKSKSWWTQYQIIEEPQIGPNQKSIKNENDDLEVKSCPKKKPKQNLRNRKSMWNVPW